MAKIPRFFTIEWLEEYLPIAARWVDEHGEEMRPWLDRLEREYRNLLKPKESDRIRALIATSRAQDQP